jgi:hypothetical protein
MFFRCVFPLTDWFHPVESSSNMSPSFLSSKKSKPKEKDAVPSGFDWSHAKLALSMAASVSKMAGIPHLEGATEIATKIIEIVEVCLHNTPDN